jgi:hypothetical protein
MGLPVQAGFDRPGTQKTRPDPLARQQEQAGATVRSLSFACPLTATTCNPADKQASLSGISTAAISRPSLDCIQMWCNYGACTYQPLYW